MTDTKVSALTAITSATTDDLLYIVDDPGGTPASKKITFDNLQKSITNVSGSLSTGLLKVTTTTGALSTASASDLPSGIDATKIGAGAVSNTEFGYVDGVTSNIQTQLNALAPYHTTTQAYITSLGSTPTDIYRVDQCIRALDAAGILSVMVDGCFMRTTQNLTSGTALKTINGVSATIVGSPDIGAKGMTCNGTSQYAEWAVTSTKVATASVQFKGVVTGQTSSNCILCLQNSSGWSSGAGTGCNIQMISNGTSTGYVFTGESGTVAVTDSWYEGTFSSLTLHPANPYDINYIVSTDNAASPTIKMYCNGILTTTDSTGNVQSTGNRDLMVIGCRHGNAGVGGASNFSKGTFAHWFLFNRVLTDTEVAALQAATRWLDPRERNIVYLGDSTSAFFFTKPTDSWAYQYEKLLSPSSAYHVNVAINGYTAATLNTLYTNRVQPFRPGVNGVDTTDLFIWLGINDINTGSTDSATYTTLKALWAKAKKDGFTVHIGTLMPGTSYTPTMEGYRTALNTSMLSDVSLYDTYFRPDLVFPDPNDSTYYLDGFHLKLLGNSIIANARAREEALENIPPKMYPLVDGTNIATDASLVPNDSVCYVTLGGNRTLSNPTNPTAGQRITYKFIQDGTGSRTISLDTKFRAGSYLVTLPTTPSSTSYLEVIYNLPDDKWDVVAFNTPSNSLIGTIGITIDGGGSAITTGVKGYIEIPYACTINRATLLADQSGSCVIDIWKDTYANYPPTVADTITASAKPTLSAAAKSQDSTLTGWTTSIAAGDVLGFNVNSASTVTRVHLSLRVTKTI